MSGVRSERSMGAHSALVMHQLKHKNNDDERDCETANGSFMEKFSTTVSNASTSAFSSDGQWSSFEGSGDEVPALHNFQWQGPSDATIATLRKCFAAKKKQDSDRQAEIYNVSNAPKVDDISMQPTFQLERCSLDEFWGDEGEEGEISGDTLSFGSVGHLAGACTPCKFYRSRRGCRMGTQCNLCHHPHEELTHSGIRRVMRDSARAKREQQVCEGLANTVTTMMVAKEIVCQAITKDVAPKVAALKVAPPPPLPHEVAAKKVVPPPLVPHFDAHPERLPRYICEPV